jgi:3-methyladenine DNA glycosylase AlkD
VTTQAILLQLEALGTEQNRKTYRRHGAGENLFGVSFADLGKLRIKIKTNHPVALELWATGNADARNLATLIADPVALTGKIADAWARDVSRFHCYVFAKLIGQSPLVRVKCAKWRDSTSELIACVGWRLVGELAQLDPELDDAYFEPLMREIERDIHSRPNWVRHAMNSALCAMGIRNAALRKKAISSAKKIGEVSVDMGDTSCEVPDAAGYIRKAAARKKKGARKG